MTYTDTIKKCVYEILNTSVCDLTVHVRAAWVSINGPNSIPIFTSEINLSVILIMGFTSFLNMDFMSKIVRQIRTYARLDRRKDYKTTYATLSSIS